MAQAVVRRSPAVLRDTVVESLSGDPTDEKGNWLLGFCAQALIADTRTARWSVTAARCSRLQYGLRSVERASIGSC